MEENILTQKTGLSFRYIFDKADQHEISSDTLINAEKAFLDYINSFSKETGIEIQLRSLPKKDGSLEDIFVVCVNIVGTGLFQILINQFFAPKNRLSGPENTKLTLKNLTDIREAHLSGKISQEQVKIFFDNDKHLKKHKNEFFTQLTKDTTIKSLEYGYENDKTIINKEEFKDRIDNDKKKIEEIYKGKIFIVSPVFDPNSKENWTGYFGTDKINFKIKDKTFLNKVYNNTIAISSMQFFIDCEVKVVDSGSKRDYIVTKINNYGEDKNYKSSKKTKIKPKDKDQGTLF